MITAIKGEVSSADEVPISIQLRVASWVTDEGDRSAREIYYAFAVENGKEYFVSFSREEKDRPFLQAGLYVDWEPIDRHASQLSFGENFKRTDLLSNQPANHKRIDISMKYPLELKYKSNKSIIKRHGRLVVYERGYKIIAVTAPAYVFSEE